MSKLYLADPNSYDVKISKIKRHFSHKVEVYPPGSCPLTVQLSFLRTAAGQTCGKCALSGRSSACRKTFAEGDKRRCHAADA